MSSSDAPPPSSLPPAPSTPALGVVEWRRYVLPALFLAACFFALLTRKPPQEAKPLKPVSSTYWSLRGKIFGTSYLVKLRALQAPSMTEAKLQEHLHQALLRVDGQMSTYKKNSELSRFNTRLSTEAINVSPALFQVVEAAQRVSDLSGGAFDITVKPIVDAWGFGPPKVMSPPSPEKIADARLRVGYKKLLLDPKTRTLKKAIPALSLDLSAIAKGYGVDVLAEHLEALGVRHYMAEIGGEIRARGVNPEGLVWRIGVEKPTDVLVQRVQEVVVLQDAAMATSGNYRNYIMVDGRRVSHLIDARTSLPVSHGLASVSVIHETCMMADALATALYVLGPNEGLALATTHKWPVLFLVPKDGGFLRLASPAFEARMKSSKRP